MTANCLGFHVVKIAPKYHYDLKAVTSCSLSRVNRDEAYSQASQLTCYCSSMTDLSVCAETAYIVACIHTVTASHGEHRGLRRHGRLL